MYILHSTLVYVTVKFGLRCRNVMTMNYADCLYNACIVFLVVSPIQLSAGPMGVFGLACSFRRVIAPWL
jgi:hypothetical protein